MTNNNEQLDKDFIKGVQGLHKLNMTPREKGEILHRLTNYAEARPVPKTSALVALFLRLTRAFRHVK